MQFNMICAKKTRPQWHKKSENTYNMTIGGNNMLDFILSTIFWTLALYGLFEIIKNIIYINTYTKFKSDGIYLIIAVKNQEEKIEGFLRSILFKILYGKEDYLKNIIVADLKSTDKTKEIAKKISQEYECLKVLNWKECKEIIENIDIP